MTGVEIEQITDIDIYQFFERGIRGGQSTIMGRHARANNKDMGDNFNPDEPSKYLLYVDMNNLYGGAMCQSLPTHGFEWLDGAEDAENTSQIINHCLTIPEDGKYGMTLEVDLDYPEELHDLHNDYPLCPEHIIITAKELSSKQREMRELLGGTPSKKLVGNLRSKKNYVVHYRYLKFCIEMGMVVRKLHRAVQYKQSKFLKPFIDFNTLQRANATTGLEKDLFKLMNNSVYGIHRVISFSWPCRSTLPS